MEKFAVIVAGGSGTRMGTSLPKQFMPVNGKPVLWYTLTVFLNSFSDIQIILVLPEIYMKAGLEIKEMTSDPARILAVAGGETRFHSVGNGLKHVSAGSIVLIHDGVRCLVTPQLIHRCYDMAMEKGNATAAITAVDTIRIEHADGNEMIDRNKIKIIQTPQAFNSDIIKKAFEQDYHESFTDEAGVAERSGIKIWLAEGEVTNIKITRPLDILIAEKILEERMGSHS